MNPPKFGANPPFQGVNPPNGAKPVVPQNEGSHPKHGPKPAACPAKLWYALGFCPFVNPPLNPFPFPPVPFGLPPKLPAPNGFHPVCPKVPLLVNPGVPQVVVISITPLFVVPLGVALATPGPPIREPP